MHSFVTCLEGKPEIYVIYILDILHETKRPLLMLPIKLIIYYDISQENIYYTYSERREQFHIHIP